MGRQHAAAVRERPVEPARRRRRRQPLQGRRRRRRVATGARGYDCQYVARQTAVKAKYHLSVTAAERTAMASVLTGCPSPPVPTASVPPLGGFPEYSPPAPSQPATSPPHRHPHRRQNGDRHQHRNPAHPLRSKACTPAPSVPPRVRSAPPRQGRPSFADPQRPTRDPDGDPPRSRWLRQRIDSPSACRLCRAFGAEHQRNCMSLEPDERACVNDGPES